MTYKQLTFRSYMGVKLIQCNAEDKFVIAAAKVSTQGSDSVAALRETLNDPQSDSGFINFLMKNRHGSPFEHNFFTVLVEAPIFVFREFMRHRIGFSYNEESGRYKELEGVFYLPSSDRPLQQIGKPGHYEFIEGNPMQKNLVQSSHIATSKIAYSNYQNMLNNGVAKEVARMSLPLNIYSSMYVSFNARSLMSFLSLRTKAENSTFPSYPQLEIQMVAEQMEEIFAREMPLTHASFNNNGRVSP